MFQYYKGERKHRERREREDAERRVVPGTPPTVPTPTPKNPRTNTWTKETATQLWDQLASYSASAGLIGGAMTLPQFIRALDAGDADLRGVALRVALRLPFPDERVQNNASRNSTRIQNNSNYATKLWNLVTDQGAQPFNRVTFVAYLVTPLADPLLRVALTTAAAASLAGAPLPSLALLTV